MMLPFEEKEYAPFENRLKSQVSPLSVEVSMPAFSAAKSLVPARAKELTPVKANCSTTSQEAPSSSDLKMKLSASTILSSRPLVGLQEVPLSVDLKTLLKPGQPLDVAANTFGPEAMMSLIRARSMPLFAAIQFDPLSVDLYIP